MEQIFKKINELFDEYLKTLKLENTETAKVSIEQKIIIAVWKSNKNYGEYSVEVVETVKEALKYYFPNSEAFKEGISFSQYLFGSLKKTINTSKEKTNLADKNGGEHISDDKYRRVKKVKNFFEEVRKIHGTKHPDQEDLKDSFIIEKAILALGMEEEEIWECLKMSKAATMGTESPNEDDDGMTLIEEQIDNIVDKNPIESMFASLEAMEQTLSLIDSEWEKNPSPILSELLTVFVLENGLKKDCSDYSFLNKEILNDYFKNPDHKLPEQQEIAEKYGLTKAGASKILSRFWEKIRKK